jgi:hypothetical protein
MVLRENQFHLKAINDERTKNISVRMPGSINPDLLSMRGMGIRNPYRSGIIDEYYRYRPTSGLNTGFSPELLDGSVRSRFWRGTPHRTSGNEVGII